MSRLDRLYAITEHLRRRRTGTTVAELAARFGVRERTIFRDLATLRDQHVPIVGEPGRGGGLALDPAFSIPPLALTVDEALSLWLSYRLGAMLGAVPGPRTLAGALDKVLGAMPRERRASAGAVLDRVVVGAPARAALAETARPVDAAVYRACERAFVEGVRLRIAYVDARGRRTRRTIEPHGLLVQAPLWYVLALDVAKAAPRSFRVDRIRAAEPVPGERFVPRDPRRLFAEIEAYGMEVREPAPALTRASSPPPTRRRRPRSAPASRSAPSA